MTASDFVEFSDEWGEPMLVARDQVAAIRKAQENIGRGRTTLFLKSGAMIPLITEFADVCERLAEDAGQ